MSYADEQFEDEGLPTQRTGGKSPSRSVSLEGDYYGDEAFDDTNALGSIVAQL